MTVRAGFWSRVLLANVAAALFVVAIDGGFAPGTTWSRTLLLFGIGFVYASVIGPMLAVGVPWAARRFCTGDARRDWAVIVVTILVVATIGTVVAQLVLVALGVNELRPFWRAFVANLEIAIGISLVIGTAISAYEILRERLQGAELALRTKERDESEARRMALQAQLAAIESRVHPHFLFNTLNSIAALIPNDPQAAERMTVRLSSLLRSTLNQAPGVSPLVPLGEELDTVRDYLEIERVRFGDRLRYTIDAPEEVKIMRVPRLSLQTLVENSVKYAVSTRRDGGSILVRAHTDFTRLAVDVEDDGPGFDADSIPEGHGLDLLRSRLSMIYGDGALLRVASAPGSTSVTIEVPVKVVHEKRTPAFVHAAIHAAGLHRRR